MKKIICLLFCLGLVGCTSKPIQTTSPKPIEIDQTIEFKDKSENFDISLSIYKLNDQEYRYDVTIDQPRVDMYQLQTYIYCPTETADAYPSFGFEAEDICNLVPDKIDQEQNFFKGIRLSGVSSSKDVNVKVYVFYNNNDLKVQENIELRGTYNDEAR